jgi:uncharacterized protein
VIKRLAVRGLGWLFIALGIAGLFLPVLQGILFLCIGLVILSSEYAWAHQLLVRVRKKFPSVADQMDHALQYAEKLKSRWENVPRAAVYRYVGLFMMVAGVLCALYVGITLSR